MSNDIAIFLDLDNLVIGAKQKNMTFDINLVLSHIRKITDNGRIVMRRAYGDWRNSSQQLKELTTAGFTNQSNVRLNNFSKNLADMQIVVDAMETMVDGHQYGTYALITGDRDFTPLVQSLRKRGKHVIGIGIRHSTSKSFAALCDEYIYYETLVPKPEMTGAKIEEILTVAVDRLLSRQKQVRISVLQKEMSDLSGGTFDKTHYSGSFSKWLANYPTILTVHQDGTTTYIQKPKPAQKAELRPLHKRYRSHLKQQRLRIVPSQERILILRDMITHLQQDKVWRWRELINHLSEKYQTEKKDISKNALNAVFLVARHGEVVQTKKDRSLGSAPVSLNIEGDKVVQQAIVRCDAVYLREILNSTEPFEAEEAAIALYDDPARTPYIKAVMKKWMGHAAE